MGAEKCEPKRNSHSLHLQSGKHNFIINAARRFAIIRPVSCSLPPIIKLALQAPLHLSPGNFYDAVNFSKLITITLADIFVGEKT
jgi:hypothetical protein